MQASSSTHILCQYCSQFVERISLLKHINKDLGYRPYVCNQCFGPSTIAFTAEDDFCVHSFKEHGQIHSFSYEANDLKEKFRRDICTSCYEMDTENAAATTQANSETETGNGGLVGISLSAPAAPIDPQFTSHTPAVHSLSSTPEISNRCDSSGSNELVFPTQQNLQMAKPSQCLMSSVGQHHQQLQHSMEQIQMESASAMQAASNFSPPAPNTSLNFDLPSGSNSEHCRSTGTLPTPVAGTPQDPEESSFCGGQQLQQNQTCSNPPVSDPSVSETPAAATRSVDHNQSRRIPSPKTPPLPTSPHRRQLLLQTAAAAAKNKRLRADAEPEIQEVQQILMQSLPANKSRRTLSTESPNKSHSQEKNASDKNDPTTTSSNPSSSFRLVTPTSTPRVSPNPEQNPMQEAQEQTAIDNVTPFMSPDDFNFADILGDLFGAGDNFDTPDPNIPTPKSPNLTSTATSQENPIQTASAPKPTEMEASVSATPKVAAAVETSVTSTAPQTNVGNDIGQVNPLQPQPQAAAAGAIAASVFPPRTEREDGKQNTGAEKSATSSHQVQGIKCSRVKNEEIMGISTKQQQRHQVARRSRPFTSNRPSLQTIGKSSSHRGTGTHSYRLRQRRDSSSLSPIPKRRRTHSTRKKGSKRPSYKEISSSDDESDSPPACIEVITLSSTEEFDDDDDDSSYSNGSTNNESREEESNEESDDDDNKKKRW